MQKSWTRRSNELALDGTMKLAQTNLSGSANESQRDSDPKPKVARDELSWMNVVRSLSNPNGVAAFRRPIVPQPRWGWWNLLQLTQGSSRNPGLMDTIPLGLSAENSDVTADASFAGARN